MEDALDEPTSTEAVLKDEILRMYQDVAENPEGDYHFYHGRDAAVLFGYTEAILKDVPEGAIRSFAGVGNPHLRAGIKAGETVLDIGSGAGLDSVIAARRVGSGGAVFGVDLNPVMCRKAEAHVSPTGVPFTCHQAKMEDVPMPDDSVDVVISNGVLNLSFQKRRALEEIFRVLRPGGRISITDIVSGKQLSQNIVNDPKLWAS